MPQQPAPSVPQTSGMTTTSITKYFSVAKTVMVVALALVAYGGLLGSRVLTLEERAWLWQALRSPLTFAFGK
jgi:hypothetical protein